jgi:CRISPR-associated protein Cmr5
MTEKEASEMLTRDQDYGARIFRQIGAVKKEKDEGQKPADYADSYGSMAHKLPVLIRSAGLAQALAFVEARGKPAHIDLLNHLAKVVMKDDHANGGTLAAQSRNTEQLSEYMYLTHEVMAALVWYKRFAQSVLDVDASAATGEEGEPE